MIHLKESRFEDLCGSIAHLFTFARSMDVGEWQAQKTQTPFLELDNLSFQFPVPLTAARLQQETEPNMPWAEKHFQERIGGDPLNPPPSAKIWPFAQHNHDEHTDDQEQFSHTYPERYWPKFANTPNVRVGHRGIRFQYGDLGDVVEMLRKSPNTRQAYLPVWFPEDTGAVDGQRVPCSLGYHFSIRDGRLNCTYMIRSCDFYRHFRDDVYMTGRLVQWISQQIREDVANQPGNLVMHIMNLHVFHEERHRIGEDFKSHQLRVNQRLSEKL